MEIIRWETAEGAVFDTLCEWSWNWWGKARGIRREELACFLAHSLNCDRLPQTFVALENGVPVGMYQLQMTDDLFSRPDIYPWLANVYVDPSRRGEGIGRAMMETVRENAAAAGLSGLYLYTHHAGLYEKFGWQKQEALASFDEKKPPESLYYLEIRTDK